MPDVDVVVVGAGPAGMAGAEKLAAEGLRVLVVDEQPTPGGQIWRGLTRNPLRAKKEPGGAAAIARFLASGAQFLPETRLWQIQPVGGEAIGWSVFLANGFTTWRCNCRAVMLATGAQERPTPLEGWTIPGVMTVGSAQILLKTSSQIPSDAVWIAGSGPLPLLYMNQLLQAGGKIAGYLDTSPRGAFRRALPRIAGAIRGDWRGLLQGLGWNLRLRFAGVAVWRNVSELAACGTESNERLEAISFRDAAGRIRRMAASVFLLHEGLIPQTDITRSLGCDHEWIPEHRSFAPRLDDLGATTVPNIFVAGDGAGIAGADAAVIRGRLAAIGIIQKLIPASLGEPDRWVHDVDDLRNKLKRLGKRHHFLNALFPPPKGLLNVNDDVLICRCEEVRADTLRAAFTEFSDGGPDEIKIRTRCGMGACQGRQCGDALTQMFAAAHGRTVSDVGLFRSRPPVRPITLSELADLDACRQNPPEWEGKSDGPV